MRRLTLVVHDMTLTGNPKYDTACDVTVDVLNDGGSVNNITLVVSTMIMTLELVSFTGYSKYDTACDVMVELSTT